MIPALIGGMVALGTTAANVAISRKNAREQREWQEQMWHSQNVYNNPANAANRMRQAGLNPYALTGSQAVGSAGSSGQGAVANTPPLSNPLEGALAMAQLKSISAETDKTVNESARILEQIKLDQQALREGVLTEEQYKMRTTALREAYEKYNPITVEIENMLADTGLKTADTGLKESQIDVNFATIAEKINNIDISNEKLSIEQKRIYFDELRTMSDIALNESYQHNIESKTQAQHFYNEFIQPTEYQINRIESFIKQNELQGTQLDNQFKKLMNTKTDLQNKLATGDASGFVTYLNYYLQSLIGVANTASKFVK